MQALASVLESEREEHFAILSVTNNDEATHRGESLAHDGIQVIPFIPEGGDYEFIDEALAYITPSSADRLRYVGKLINSRKLRSAANLLKSWAADSTADERTMADVSAAYVHFIQVAQASKEWEKSPEIVEMARSAVELCPSSIDAAFVVIYVHTAQVIDASPYRLAFSKLSECVQSADFPTVQAARDETIRRLYKALRMCDPGAMRTEIAAMRRQPRWATGGGRDRLAVLELRAGLLANELQPSREVFGMLASRQVAGYGQALADFHTGRFDQAIEALEKVERHWRAAQPETKTRGLGFTLWLRAMCLFGLKHFDDARLYMQRTQVSYGPIQKRAWRRFNHDVPSELSYDPRRFGSEELATLCNFWVFVGDVAAVGGKGFTQKVGDLRRRLEADAASDLLFQWLSLLLQEASPGSALQKDNIDARYSLLLSQTRRHCPGIAPWIVIPFEVLRDSLPEDTFDNNHIQQLRSCSTIQPGVE